MQKEPSDKQMKIIFGITFMFLLIIIITMRAALAAPHPCSTHWTDCILNDDFDNYVIDGSNATTVSDGDGCDAGGWTETEDGCIYNQTGVINGTGSIYLDETMNGAGGSFNILYPDVITEGVNDSTVCVNVKVINGVRLYFELNDGSNQCLMGIHAAIPGYWFVMNSIQNSSVAIDDTNYLCMVIGEADNKCTYYIDGEKIHNKNQSMNNGGVSYLKFSVESDSKFILDDIVVTTYSNGTMPEYLGAGAADPCDPPGSGDWEVSTDCDFSTDKVIPGNVVITGDSVLSARWSFTTPGSTVSIESGGSFNIASGGGF